MRPHSPSRTEATALPPRGAANFLSLVVYTILGVAAPSLLIIWGTTLVELPGAAAARILLFFLVLPCFFVYIGIVLGRYYPRSLLGSLRFYIPLAINLALYGLSFSSLEAFGVAYMLSGLPLFLGFMLLLLLGLTALIVSNVSLRELNKVIVSFIIVALGAAPVVFTALLGYELNVAYADETAAWKIALSYVTSIALVFALHVRPIRELYQAGRL